MDVNSFKKDIKEWIKANPLANVDELRDECESLIPPHQLASYDWLIEQTVAWYSHVLASRQWQKSADGDDEVA